MLSTNTTNHECLPINKQWHQGYAHTINNKETLISYYKAIMGEKEILINEE